MWSNIGNENENEKCYANLWRYGASKAQTRVPQNASKTDFPSIHHQSIAAKPNGWWVSVDDDWPKWWVSEMMDEERVAHRSRVCVPLGKLYTVRNLQDADTLVRDYGVVGRKEKENEQNVMLIDWGRLIRDHHPDKLGFLLLIRPETLLKQSKQGIHHWVSHWDVRSGVLWDVRGVRTIT